MNEFDEQAVGGKEDALRRLTNYQAKFLRGEETMAIVDAMEMACVRAGATVAECERALKRAERN